MTWRAWRARRTILTSSSNERAASPSAGIKKPKFVPKHLLPGFVPITDEQLRRIAYQRGWRIRFRDGRIFNDRRLKLSEPPPGED
jgi:hypothetical protein